MADNYIERQMEDFRAGRLGGVRRGAPAGPRVRVPFIGDPGATEAIVRALRQEGFRVDFTLGDTRAGNLIAQRTGARFLPSAHGH